MIILLGASGYVGSAYQCFFKEKNIPYVPVARAEVDYYDRAALIAFLREKKAHFLINCAGYTGKPNVDACELHKADCTLGNAVLPGIIKEACDAVDIPWGHVSSGCIYTGKKDNGDGFSEEDAPNFSFRSNYCSFYSGTKALGEEILADAKKCYVWRLRIPFNHSDSARNYLSKLMRYSTLLEAENSISHLDEFVACTYACFEKNIPYGIYNVTNRGSVTTRAVVQMILDERKRREDAGISHTFPKTFEFFESESSFMEKAAKTPRSNCVMDVSKLTEAGIAIRTCEEAIRDALKHWQPETP